MIEIDRISEFSGDELGIAEEFSVVSVSSDVSNRGSVFFIEIPIGHKVLISGDLRSGIRNGALLLGKASRIVGVEPKNHSIDRIFGQLRGLAVVYRSRTDVHDVALQLDVENGAVSRNVSKRIVPYDRSYRCVGGKAHALVGPNARRSTGIKTEIAVMEGRARQQVAQFNSEISFHVARRINAVP